MMISRTTVVRGPTDFLCRHNGEIVAPLPAEHDADAVPIYIDRGYSLMGEFDAFSAGLPFTIFIDGKGREAACVSGPQKWDDLVVIEDIWQLAEVNL